GHFERIFFRYFPPKNSSVATQADREQRFLMNFCVLYNITH
ncbi:MAG: hypothetical protein ACI85O_002965, partial [Saprospiraceae bacterium]